MPVIASGRHVDLRQNTNELVVQQKVVSVVELLENIPKTNSVR